MPLDCFCLGTTTTVFTGSVGFAGSAYFVTEGHHRKRKRRAKSEGSGRSLNLFCSTKRDALQTTDCNESRLAQVTNTIFNAYDGANPLQSSAKEYSGACAQANAVIDRGFARVRLVLPGQELEVFGLGSEMDARVKALQERAQASERRVAELEVVLAEWQHSIRRLASESGARVRELEDLLRASMHRIQELESALGERDLTAKREETKENEQGSQLKKQAKHIANPIPESALSVARQYFATSCQHDEHMRASDECALPSNYQTTESQAPLTEKSSFNSRPAKDSDKRDIELEEREQLRRQQNAERDASFEKQRIAMNQVGNERHIRLTELEEFSHAHEQRIEELSVVQKELAMVRVEVERNTQDKALEERTEIRARRIIELESLLSQQESATIPHENGESARARDVDECVRQTEVPEQESLNACLASEKDALIKDLEELAHCRKCRIADMARSVDNKVIQAKGLADTMKARKNRIAWMTVLEGERNSRVKELEQQVKTIHASGNWRNEWKKLISSMAQKELALTRAEKELAMSREERLTHVREVEQRSQILCCEKISLTTRIHELEHETHVKDTIIHDLKRKVQAIDDLELKVLSIAKAKGNVDGKKIDCSATKPRKGHRTPDAALSTCRLASPLDHTIDTTPNTRLDTSLRKSDARRSVCTSSPQKWQAAPKSNDRFADLSTAPMCDKLVAQAERARLTPGVTSSPTPAIRLISDNGVTAGQLAISC